MSERPSAVNDSASAQQILQLLQGSLEQAAPPTTSSSQAGATSGTTASGDNASQNSSQENANGANVSNNSTVNLEVFSYNVLVLYSSWGLLVISCCPTLHFLVYVFSRYLGAGFKFRAWSTWSVSIPLGSPRYSPFKCYAIVCCFILCYLLLHSFVFFFFVCCYELGLLYIWELFLFWLRTEEIIYAVCTFSCLSLKGRRT